MNKKIMLAAAGLFLIPLLAGPVHAGGSHACDYLTVKEVSKVMGYKAAAPESKPPNPMGQSICFFDAPEAAGFSFAQVQLVTSSSPKLKKLRFTVASLYKNNTGYISGPKKITGLGDKAVWGGSGIKMGGSGIKMGAGLHVLYKNLYFVVQAKSGGNDSSLAKSKQLAKIIISKIK